MITMVLHLRNAAMSTSGSRHISQSDVLSPIRLLIPTLQQSLAFSPYSNCNSLTTYQLTLNTQALTMADYITYIRAHLEMLGWPSHIFDSVMRHVKGDDIVGMGIRLAMIGLMASFVRTFVSSVYTWINHAKSP